METETQKNAPILNIAWTRVAHLDDISKRRTRGYYRMRRWISILGIIATIFAVLTQIPFLNVPSVLGIVVKVMFIAAPAVASVLAAFASKYFSNGDWLITRAGAEEIQKEIYFYRTINKNRPNRRGILEKRLAEIQRQIYRALGGEFSFETYNGQIPPNYYPDDPTSDPGFADLTGDEYLKYRLENQLMWHNKEINEYKVERRNLTIFILAMGGLGTVLAAVSNGSPLALLVAVTSSITAALIGWQELRNVDVIVRNYSKVVLELTILYDHWLNLESEERTEAEFRKMVNGCEAVLWGQNTEYIKSMQEVLKESEAELKQEAQLIEDVLEQSVASAERTKQMMRDTVVEAAQGALQDAEQRVEETFKTTIGTLAEEASSEIVQKELDAMSKAVTEAAENVFERTSALTSSLAQIAQEFAHVDIGRDTSKEELNAILARYPKTNDVKG
jgi:hypothetical protein